MRVHERDRVGLAGGSRCPSRSRSPRTRPTSPPTTRAQGRFAFSGGYFVSAKARPRRCTRRPTSLAGGNGVYRYGAASGFPDQTFNGTNYWVDAVFEPDAPARHAAAAGERLTPAARRHRRAAVEQGHGRPSTSPSSPPTVNAGSFTLNDGAGNPVPAPVSYDAGPARRR